jgi:putative membrane-bound dehydrogenase-like protein
MKKYIFHLFLFVLTFLSFSYKLGDLPPNDDTKLYLPDDLEATLWAESPLFYNPTNMDTDHKGRIWVTEAVNYRNFNNDSAKVLHHAKGDRVMILEDTEKDGKADKSTVFVEDPDLISPLGIAVVGNKVIVSCSPNLIVYTDENGDDKPDKKEIILTGFGGKDHDHALHSVVVGPDGKWYFNVGNAGPHMVTDKSGFTLRSGSIYTGGSPYNQKNTGNRKSDDGRIWVGGIQMSMNPDGTGLKVLGHGFRNSYETAVDSYGDMWQNDNDDQVVTCRVSWLMEGGNAGYFSKDGMRYWQADQRPNQPMFAAHWHQDDPGFMPAGDNSGAGSPTGVALNEGDGLGEKYRGMLFSADAGRNVIFDYMPELKGAGFNLIGKRTNFITSLSNDNAGYVWNDPKNNTDETKWFRPSDVMIGTDGAMYIADWYDPVVGGHQMKDNKGYGRIYRITQKNKKNTTPTIDLNTVEGQIEALKNPAVNVRSLGFEKLKAQPGLAFEPVKLLLKSNNPYHQARAIALLAQLGEQGQAEVKKLMFSADDRKAAAGFRALRNVYSEDDILEISNRYLSSFNLDSKSLKANKPSTFLLREIAIALRDFPLEKKKETMLKIISMFDGNDGYLLETIGLNLERDAENIFPDIKKIFEKKINASTSKWNQAYARLLWRLHPASEVPALKGWASNASLPKVERAKAITALGYINDKTAATSMVQLSKSNLIDVVEQANYWLSFRQSNDWIDLLDWKTIGIDLAAEKKRNEMRAAKEKILNEYISFADRKRTVEYMSKDKIGGQILMSMVASKTLPQDLYNPVEALIFNNPNQAVRVQAGNYFKHQGGVTYSYAEIAKIKPDVKKGQQLFVQSCGSCHKASRIGKDIGPDLTLINKKFDRVSLLDAIINPNAAIVFGYEPWLIDTKDGDSFFGFILADDKTVVIKDAGGTKHTILKENILKRTKQTNSLMPDASSMGLSNADLASVSAFLLNLKAKTLN